MIDRAKKTTLSLFTILAVCILVLISVNTLIGSEYSEETPETVLPYDDVITGTMDSFSERVIYVDGIGFRFCDSVKIFNPRNKLIQVEDIEAAVEVKIFSNKGCVRKMKVLRFAQ